MSTRIALMKSHFVLLLLAVAGAANTLAQSKGSFARTGDMMMARSQHTATLLPTGKVLIAGGSSTGRLEESLLASAELYDPVTGTFSATGNMTTGRWQHSATLLPDGNVLITGGYGAAAPLASAELYDPSSGTFTATGNMLTQGWHSAKLLGNGKVLITGGFTLYPNLANAELYDPATGTFAATGSYAPTRFICEVCPPSILLAGGTVLSAGTSPAQLYDPVTGAFRATGASSDFHSAAVLLVNGTVLFAGGESLSRLATAELYDPVSGSFKSAPNMAWRRAVHTATLLPDGAALIAGGDTEECSGNSCTFSGTTESVEIYDPSSGTFVSTGSMSTSRGAHTATLLNDGRVLIAGGVSYGGIGIFFGHLASAEVYTPAVLKPAPALFSMSGDGRGQGAILHAGTARVASPSNPAVSGEALEVYLTGLADESVIPPQVFIGGRMAEVLWFGNTPDFAGLNQINVRVPNGVVPGPAVPVRLTYLGRPTNEVTIGVQ